jgi:hypothetical protein
MLYRRGGFGSRFSGRGLIRTHRENEGVERVESTEHRVAAAVGSREQLRAESS